MKNIQAENDADKLRNFDKSRRFRKQTVEQSQIEIPEINDVSC